MIVHTIFRLRTFELEMLRTALPHAMLLSYDDPFLPLYGPCLAFHSVLFVHKVTLGILQNFGFLFLIFTATTVHGQTAQ